MHLHSPHIARNGSGYEGVWPHWSQNDNTWVHYAVWPSLCFVPCTTTSRETASLAVNLLYFLWCSLIRDHPALNWLYTKDLCVCFFFLVYHVPVLQSTTSAPVILSAYPSLRLCLHLSIHLSVHLSSGHRLYCFCLQASLLPPCWYQCPSQAHVHRNTSKIVYSNPVL